MHRDLKLEYLLLRTKDKDSDVIIADFGLALIFDQQPLYKRCGTPGFVESVIFTYIDNCPFYNEKCDIFNAGIVFYMLIIEAQPFEGSNYKEIIQSKKDLSNSLFSQTNNKDIFKFVFFQESLNSQEYIKENAKV
ncbi:unnamed protein product [Paramecium sonneborni]|uniref:Protein kinase domain-containing protein n=1 Tax=Paramecium sonneborni TaxID=65129 RepID=A0A8S1RV07_9CILI|nr:unnamed protein product [Paramecium sonneborni]